MRRRNIVGAHFGDGSRRKEEFAMGMKRELTLLMPGRGTAEKQALILTLYPAWRIDCEQEDDGTKVSWPLASPWKAQLLEWKVVHKVWHVRSFS